MKKYLLGFLSVAVAIIGFAFTKPVKHTFSNYLFQYTAPGGSYTIANVTDKTKWAFVSVDGTPSCDATPEKACQLLFEAAGVDASGTPILNSSASITAVESITNVAYVTGGTDINTISNQVR